MSVIGIGIAVAAAWGLAGMEERGYRRLLTALGTGLLLSEIWKQWFLTFRVYGGHYNVWYFPFQLCALPMYLCPLYGRVPEKWRERIGLFLMDFTLMGGVAVFLDPSGMRFSQTILTVHAYLWHFILIFLGALSGFRFAAGRAGRPFSLYFKEFGKTLPIWAGGVAVATLLNVVLWPLGEISMFYLSPFEASTQMVIRDIAARFGILAGNLTYLSVMVGAAAAFHAGWCLLRVKRPGRR